VTDGDCGCSRPTGNPVAPVLLDGLREARLGSGVLLCLPRDTDEQQVGTMLAAARAVLSMSAPARFVVVATGVARPAWPGRCSWRHPPSPPRWSPCRCRKR